MRRWAGIMLLVCRLSHTSTLTAIEKEMANSVVGSLHAQSATPHDILPYLNASTRYFIDMAWSMEWDRHERLLTELVREGWSGAVA